MIKTILKTVLHGNPRSVPYWTKLMGDTNTRLTLQKDRFIMAELAKTRGVEVLRSILFSADIPYLLKLNDIDRYGKYLSFIEDEIAEQFDSTYTTKTSGQMFITDLSNATEEFAIPVHTLNPLLVLPIDKPYDKWQDIDPVHFVYHDSIEMPSDFLQCTAKFKKFQPSYGLTSINIITYLYKAVKYFEANPGTFYQELIDDFVHDEILPVFYNDFVRIWSTNVMLNILEAKFNDEQNKYDELLETYSNAFLIGSAFRYAVTEFSNHIDIIREKNIAMGDFMATKWLLNTSIYDYMTEIVRTSAMHSNRQFSWLKFIYEYPMIKLFLLIDTHTTSSVLVNTRKMLGVKLREIDRSNYMAKITKTALRNSFQAELDQMIQIT